MKILVIGMHKGGVGKTLLSRLLSEYFAINNYKILGIDLDNQCNYSRRFLNMEINHDSPEGILPPIHPEYNPADPEDKDWDGRSSIADIFFNEPVLPYPTKYKTLAIAPGHPIKLLDAERVRKQEEHIIHDRLKIFLDLPSLTSKYEIVIIDTPPSRGPLTIAALRAASHIIIPAVMETQSIEGLYGMMQLFKIESMNREHKKALELIGIQPNMFKETRQHKFILNSLRNSDNISKFLLPNTVGHRTIFSEVDQIGITPPSVFEAKKTDKARIEAIRLCELVEKRMFV